MDNVILINQARNLCAALQFKQCALSVEIDAKANRLDGLVIRAYCRYQRRLNRCVLCYQGRLDDCCQWASRNNTVILPDGHQAFNWPERRKVPRHN
ncbi:MAG: hypothetical protein QX197_11735 [Methylococcaceae bacterium]